MTIVWHISERLDAQQFCHCRPGIKTWKHYPIPSVNRQGLSWSLPPPGLHKEILDTPHLPSPLFYIRNKKVKILDSPNILIFFNNIRNSKTYSSTRKTGQTFMLIIGQLPVIGGWQDAPLVLDDLAEAICIIKLHAPHRFWTLISWQQESCK